MDIVAIKKLVESLLKEYETTETHCILFYSTDQNRDFGILRDKVNRYRSKLEKLLANGSVTTEENRAAT